jgi:two-component system, NtrC family, sensor kinase
MRAMSEVVRNYYFALWGSAVVAGIASLFFYYSEPIILSQLLNALIFVVMLTVADIAVFQEGDNRAPSVSTALIIASLTSLNWPFVLPVIALGTLCGALGRGVPWWQITSAIAIRCLAGVVGGGIALIGLWFVLTDPAFDERNFTVYTNPQALLCLLGTGLAIYGVERGADAALIALREGRSLRESWPGRMQELRWYVLMLAPLGGLLGALWKVSGWAFVLGIVPLIILQNMLRNQVELSKRNGEVQNLASERAAVTHKLERLQEITIALITIRDVPTMLKTLCDRLAALMGAANGWGVLLNDEQLPVMVAWHNLPVAPEGRGPYIVPLPQKYAAVLERQRVFLFTDQRVQTLAPLEALTEGQFWQALIFIPLVDEKRVLGAICLTFPDIRGLTESEQRILAAFARQASMFIENARLFRRVQESQAELVQSSKLAAVGTFAAGIAHEFNNLLAGMLGYAQLGLATNELETKNESLKVVVDTCKRGKSITSSLLTFSRRQEPRRELADLYEAVQGTLTLMEIELKKFSVVVERNINPVPFTICDAGQISQVFLNLLTNARDAMKPNGGTLTVTLDNDEKQIRLTVKDTGTGIPESLRDKIFEPFVTTKGALGGSATPGTGLGLSVSYGIVQSHGGTFEVESEEGKGTIMTIYLPIVTDPQQAREIVSAEQQQSEELPALRVLLVDDDQTVALSLQSLLQKAGHTVVFLNDAVIALDEYRNNAFDIVLTDIQMPRMSGIELTTEILRHNPEALVIACTGQAMGEQIAQAKAAGALDVLRKPFELEEVIAAMSTAWKQKVT